MTSRNMPKQVKAVKAEDNDVVENNVVEAVKTSGDVTELPAQGGVENPETKTTEEAEAPKLSAEEKARRFAALDPVLQLSVNQLNETIREHNNNIALIKSALEASTPKLLAEIREENPHDDPELTEINGNIAKLEKNIEDLKSRIEDLVRAGSEIVKAKYLKTKATPEQVEKATQATQVSGANIRNVIMSLKTFEQVLRNGGEPVEILVHADEVHTLRGISLAGATKASTSAGKTSGAAQRRPRFTDILISVNGQEAKSIARKSIDKDGNERMRATMSFLADALNKATQTNKFVPSVLTDKYFAAVVAQGGTEKEPNETVTFTIVHEYRIEAGMATMNIEVTVIK